MMSIRKINPMARAVGTMGAVAAVAGGITFAALTSNTVALSANTLSSATAHLMIGAAGTDNTCTADNATSVSGMDLKLTPGQKSDDFNFCLKNDGDVPLDLTTSIVAGDLVDSPIPAADVKLDISCDNSGTATGTLADYVSTPQSLGTLSDGSSTDCTANATLDASYDGAGKTVNPFTLNFVGTQPTTPSGAGGTETPSV